MTITLNGTNGVTTPGVVNSAGETIATTLAVAGAASIGGAATVGGNLTATGYVRGSGVTTNIYPLVRGAAQSATGLADIEFTDIPSWVRRVTVVFATVSGSAASDWYMALGTGTGPTYVSSDYNSYAAALSTSALAGAISTTSFIIANAAPLALAYSGTITLSNFDSDTWSIHGGLGSSLVSTSTAGQFTAGGVSLGAALTAIKISVGTGTFDNGAINILYE
jgi:hypothetical protein